MDFSSRSGIRLVFARLDQEANAGREERAVGLDALVQGAKPVAIGVHGEPRHDPDDLAQEMNHGRNVVELHPAAELAQVRRQSARHASAASTDHFGSRVGPSTRAAGAHHELGQLADRAVADVLGEVRAAGLQHPGDLVPPHARPGAG